ncbi:helicase ARIP4-like isoform X2 [Sinocyclocheilus rhinocerous]|uniref:helicase ARIP4-like isoform X2 n=1 Tax=Sinocyclocheilus rhinocerous TaxID=307959 RepID=UPI0007B985A2|nr:PREDICTED: helicase ARIP4-like isoform X2 [Sinocyclocheilus rhinocerous]
MSEEAISGSDLEPSLNSEEEEEMEEEDGENDGDDEEDAGDQLESLEAEDQRDPTSPAPTSPMSRDSSPEPTSRPASQPTSTSRTSSRPGSQPPSSPDSCSNTSANSNTKKKKSKTFKPAHLRRNIRKVLKEHQLEAGTKAAQQEELERRRRLEQQRKDFPLHADLSTAAPGPKQEVICLDSSGDEAEAKEAPPPQLPAHRDDVIELSSGDEDTLRISSEEDNSEDRSVTPGTEESSGSHVNDSLNQPDTQGRVLVNINHPGDEEDLFLAPQLARAVKPHQIGGIRFLYDNLVESLERYKSSSGFGCVLAHSMGLGKTLQVISFIDVLLQHTGAKTVLAIVPVNTLQNWLAEFNLWLPAAESLPPDTDPAQVLPRTFKVHILNDEHKTTVARANVVEDWTRGGGVLLMGYEMYRLLSLKKSFVTGRKRKSKKPAGPVIIDLDEEDRQQELMKGIERALSRPGPDVVICDEGHRIKNCHASTSQALKNIRSRRRVVLTGYPLQNNLIEYWCMVDFVRPDFLGTRQEFSNMFERPILNGQCIDSTPQDVQLMRYRSHVLHSLLEGFVQRRGHDVLRNQLPGKEEHVILVRLSRLQRALYTEFMNRFREAGNTGWLGLNPLKAFCVCCKIWNHPDVLFETLQKENLANEQDLDLDDLNSTSGTRCSAPGIKGKSSDPAKSKMAAMGPLNPLQEKANQVITYEWAKDIMTNYQTGVLENSAKMVLLFHLIDESVKRGDKILVFSQSLSTLTVMEDFLSRRPMPIQTETGMHNWVRNVNYYRLDGSTSASERERLINQFNDPANNQAWVFLLSTRAGCLGVNLIGANRVVVFDASWNPCHDAQAVCRVYRYGQRKPCHIYRLVCDFTLEKKIYDRQVSKQGMSDRVVDDLNPVLTFTRKEVESLLHFVEEEPDPSQSELVPSEDLEIVIKQACLLYPHLLTKQSFHHESLLMDRKDLKLTKAEKRAAKKSYEDEKRASVPYQRPSYAHYYPASDQRLTNIPAFSQRNWRPPPHLEEKPVASVRPVQSTPIPMMPRQVSMCVPGSSAGFPVNYLQKAGVYVQRVVTTTDIVIPGSNSSTDVQARIGAGESIHVIRGSKGTYIRTNDGRIFAIRSGKPRPLEGGATEESGPPLHSVSNGRASPQEPKRLTPEALPRPSPQDSPKLLREFQSNKDPVPAEKNLPSSGTPKPSGVDRPIQNPVRIPDQHRQLSNDIASSVDVQSLKRKLLESRTSKPPSTKRTSTSTGVAGSYPGFPLSSGFGFPSMGLNPALLGALGHMTPPSLGSRSHLLQQAGQALGDLHAMFPTDQLGLGVSNSTLSSTCSTNTTSSTHAGMLAPSSSSVPSSSSSSTSSSLPPFLMNPGMASMLSGFPVPFSQPLFPGSLHPRGLSSMPAPASNFLSSSGLLGAAFNRPDTHPSLAENGGSSSDDDVIEVMGQ